MLAIHGSSRRRYREPRDKAQIILRCIITVVVVGVIALIAWLGYRWYQSLNDQPPMSVTYVHHEAKNAPLLFQPMHLKLGTVTTPLSYQQTGTISASTAAGADCRVSLYFRDGQMAEGNGMKPKKAASNGTVTWTWQVLPKYPSGIWPFTVECRNPTGDQKAEGKVTILDPSRP